MGEGEGHWARLGKDWNRFCSTLLNPLSILGLAAIGFGIWGSTISQNSTLRGAIGVGIAIITGMITAYWTSRMTEDRESSRFQLRANSAVRSLKTLDRGIVRLRERIGRLAGQNKPADSPDRTAALLEIEEGCKTLSAEVLNAIENWVDITKEADVPSILDEYQSLQEELDQAKLELSKDNESHSTNVLQPDEVQKLKQTRAKQERRIKQLERRVEIQARKLPPTVVSKVEDDGQWIHFHCPECDAHLDGAEKGVPFLCEECRETVEPEPRIPRSLGRVFDAWKNEQDD